MKISRSKLANLLPKIEAIGFIRCEINGVASIVSGIAEGVSAVSESKSAMILLFASLMITTGFSLIRRIDEGSPLKQYALQILGLAFLLPFILIVATIVDLGKDAITGLLGTIVGYIFGTSSKSNSTNTNSGDNDNRD